MIRSELFRKIKRKCKCKKSIKNSFSLSVFHFLAEFLSLAVPILSQRTPNRHPDTAIRVPGYGARFLEPPRGSPPPQFQYSNHQFGFRANQFQDWLSDAQLDAIREEERRAIEIRPVKMVEGDWRVENHSVDFLEKDTQDW